MGFRDAARNIKETRYVAEMGFGSRGWFSAW